MPGDVPGYHQADRNDRSRSGTSEVKRKSPSPHIQDFPVRPSESSTAHKRTPDIRQSPRPQNTFSDYRDASPYPDLFYGADDAALTAPHDSWAWNSFESPEDHWANISDFDEFDSPPSPSQAENLNYQNPSHRRKANRSFDTPTTGFSQTTQNTQSSGSMPASQTIDLTDDAPSSPPMPSLFNSESSSRKRPAVGGSSYQDLSAEPSASFSKRRRISPASQPELVRRPRENTKQSDAGQAGPSQSRPPKTIEEIDLVEDDDIGAILQKQREDAVRNQQPENSSGNPSSKLKTFQCTVCLDSPTEMTATACGHAFCRSCLMDWLVSGERDSPKRSNCPACRKVLHRNHKKNREVIPLEFMTRSAKTK